jgi:hypothetical protein
MSILHLFRGIRDSLSNAEVGATTTDVAGHRSVNFLTGWRRVLTQEIGSRHDLAGLAITALRHIVLLPGNLQGVRAVFG